MIIPRPFRLAVFLAGFGAAAHASAEPPEVTTIASEQRVLAQRVAKIYCQLGLGIDTPIAQRQLDEVLGRLADNQRRLEADPAPAQKGRPERAALAEATAGIAQAAAAPAGLDSARRMAALADSASAAAEELQHRLEAVDGAKPVADARLAERQAVLSQRLAKAYLLHRLGDRRSAVTDELEAAANELSAGVARLAAGARNTAATEEAQALSLQDRKSVV